MPSRAHTRSKVCIIFYHSNPEIVDPVPLAACVSACDFMCLYYPV
jgi:hypothetical protein